MTDRELTQILIKLASDFRKFPRPVFEDKLNAVRKKYRKAHDTDSNDGFHILLHKFISDYHSGILYKIDFPNFTNDSDVTLTDKIPKESDTKRRTRLRLEATMHYIEEDKGIYPSFETWINRTEWKGEVWPIKSFYHLYRKLVSGDKVKAQTDSITT